MLIAWQKLIGNACGFPGALAWCRQGPPYTWSGAFISKRAAVTVAEQGEWQLQRKEHMPPRNRLPSLSYITLTPTLFLPSEGEGQHGACVPSSLPAESLHFPFHHHLGSSRPLRHCLLPLPFPGCSCPAVFLSLLHFCLISFHPLTFIRND